MKVEQVLEKVRDGSLGIDHAKQMLQEASAGFAEMDFAKLDLDRKSRTGFPEVVYCQGKDHDHLLEIYERLWRAEGEVFGTRACQEQYEALAPHLAGLTFDSRCGVLKIEREDKKHTGNVVICTAGTSDVRVAEEAAQTASFFGCDVHRVYDVGVSGLHRLMSRLEIFRKAYVIVAVAGMEGALPSVLGGLVACPVIAVPTSVGYGTGLGGVSALMGMLNSCANGICVVNIDNGYGAGYLAAQINRLACGGREV